MVNKISYNACIKQITKSVYKKHTHELSNNRPVIAYIFFVKSGISTKQAGKYCAIT